MLREITEGAGRLGVTFGHRKSAGDKPAGNEDILRKLTQMHLKEEQIMNCGLNDSKVKGNYRRQVDCVPERKENGKE